MFKLGALYAAGQGMEVACITDSKGTDPNAGPAPLGGTGANIVVCVVGVLES